MVGPVPGSGSPSQRLSSLFFGPELCQFVVNVVVVVGVIVLVALSVCRGAFGAVAGAVAALLDTFYVRHLERAVVLVVASKVA